LRNIDDIFGDFSSTSLAHPYPKWTCFHAFIQEVILSLIVEQTEERETEDDVIWVDRLFVANGFEVDTHLRDQLDPNDYIEVLIESGHVEMLTEKMAKEVFHVLFSNRSTMSSFGKMVSYHVLENAPAYAPDAFLPNGKLRRVNPPGWAKSAIFHRDKGRCVLCKKDLTRLYSQESTVHYDHIVPLARGGMNCITNLQLTCADCNLRKGASSSSTSEEYEVWYDY
jgi:hypothetical protein